MSYKLVVWQGPTDKYCRYSSIGGSRFGFMSKEGEGLNEDEALALWITLRLPDNVKSFIADPADLPQDRFCRNSWVIDSTSTFLIMDMILARKIHKEVIVRSMRLMRSKLKREIDSEEKKVIRADAISDTSASNAATNNINTYTVRREAALDKSLDLDSELAAINDESGLRAYWPSEIDPMPINVDDLQQPVFKPKV